MRIREVTMSDVAREAGVSQSAVSMILNQKTDSFPTETIERVLKTAEQLNYSFHKKVKPSGKDILLLCPQHTNPFYASMLQSIDRAAIPQGIRVLSACTYHSPEAEEPYLQMAIRQKFLGVIFLYPPDNPITLRAAAAHLPVIILSDQHNNTPGDIIELNNFEAGAMAARHLIELGHTNIAMLTSSTVRSTSARAIRVAGILSEIKKHVSKDHFLILSNNSTWQGVLEKRSFHYQAGFSLAQSKQLQQQNITGLICVNDLTAYGAMDALSRMGYRIPEDFSIIGSDNLLYSDMSQISLTTVEHSPDIVAQAALTTLLNRTSITTSSIPSAATAQFRVVCRPSLVIRSSTGPARTSPLPER